MYLGRHDRSWFDSSFVVKASEGSESRCPVKHATGRARTLAIQYDRLLYVTPPP